jgi:hypothetical protein
MATNPAVQPLVWITGAAAVRTEPDLLDRYERDPRALTRE